VSAGMDVPCGDCGGEVETRYEGGILVGVRCPRCDNPKTLREQVAALTRERDEARAEAARAKEKCGHAAELIGTYTTGLELEGNPESKTLNVALAHAVSALDDTSTLDWLAERLAAQREAGVQWVFKHIGLNAGGGLANMLRATPLVNGSDSWLAEVKAEARDAALEEAAKRIEYEFSLSVHSQLLEAIRALKRGGK
jgi:alkyl sulfatase BDS1-like metallo-beta-lactamase superfamily hydrolase